MPWQNKIRCDSQKCKLEHRGFCVAGSQIWIDKNGKCGEFSLKNFLKTK